VIIDFIILTWNIRVNTEHAVGVLTRMKFGFHEEWVGNNKFRKII